MKYLEWLEFEDVIGRFKWYPNSFTLLIFCDDEETFNLFNNEIEKQGIKWKEVFKTKKCIEYKKDPYQRLSVCFTPAGPFLGVRANAIFINSSVSIEELHEIFLPLANISPKQGLYVYDKWALKKMFELKGNHTACDGWETYMLGLEKED